MERVVNSNTRKFHYPGCDSVNKMKESNKLYYIGTRDDLISQGYNPYKNCHPQSNKKSIVSSSLREYALLISFALWADELFHCMAHEKFLYHWKNST